jgi:hypothetical protein
VVTIVDLARKSVELSLARRDGTDLGMVTIGTGSLTDLVHGVQAVVVALTTETVRLGLESPAGGGAGRGEEWRD